MRRIRRIDLLTPLIAGGFYLFNRFFLQKAATGMVHWFLHCYANDLFAGAAILAWLNLLLGLGGLGRVKRLRHAAAFLLLCGLVWEVAAPLWRAGAVCDPWDLLAYQLGGLIYLVCSGQSKRAG